jgi:hypothetical protein
MAGARKFNTDYIRRHWTNSVIYYNVNCEILLYSFPSQHSNVKNSLTFTVYSQFIGLDVIATCFGLSGHYQAVYTNIYS